MSEKETKTELKTCGNRFDRIDQRLDEHTDRFDAVDETLVKHSKRFDKVEETLAMHNKRFDDVRETQAKHSTQLDIFARKFLEHDEQFLLVRQEIAGLRQEISTRDDEMLTILRRIDQELVATVSWIRRVEEKTDKNTTIIAHHATDIASIKQHLNMG